VVAPSEWVAEFNVALLEGSLAQVSSTSEMPRVGSLPRSAVMQSLPVGGTVPDAFSVSAELPIAGQGCPVHQGSVHGGEAEELRSGIETLISIGDTGGPVGVADLQALIDRVDARDSLGYLERIDLAAGIAAILADDNLTSGKVRAKLRDLLDSIA
jgi:hypothetical protein